MQTNTKKILLGMALFFVGLGLIAAQKAKNLADTFSQLKASFKWADNPVLGWKYLQFDMDVKITNPTAEPFSVSNSFAATLTRIAIIHEGVPLGSIAVDRNELSIPAYDSIVIRNLPVSIPLENIAQYATSIESIKNLLARCKIVCYVTVLGTEYIIEN